MAETINPNELIIGNRYQIFNPYYRNGFPGSITNPYTGNFVGVSNNHKGALFNRLAHLGFNELPAEYRLGNRPFDWRILRDERNTMLRKKNQLERPRGKNGLSLKNEIIEQGPWNPRRVESSGFGYNMYNDPDSDFQPTFRGIGRSLEGGRYKRKSRRRKSRRTKSRRSMV